MEIPFFLPPPVAATLGGEVKGGGSNPIQGKGETLEGTRENDERAAAHVVGTHRNTQQSHMGEQRSILNPDGGW